jgi:hypothetical protein
MRMKDIRRDKSLYLSEILAYFAERNEDEGYKEG